MQTTHYTLRDLIVSNYYSKCSFRQIKNRSWSLRRRRRQQNRSFFIYCWYITAGYIWNIFTVPNIFSLSILYTFNSLLFECIIFLVAVIYNDLFEGIVWNIVYPLSELLIPDKWWPSGRRRTQRKRASRLRRRQSARRCTSLASKRWWAPKNGARFQRKLERR